MPGNPGKIRVSRRPALRNGIYKNCRRLDNENGAHAAKKDATGTI
jgi:hypothetical protein